MRWPLTNMLLLFRNFMNFVNFPVNATVSPVGHDRINLSPQHLIKCSTTISLEPVLFTGINR